MDFLEGRGQMDFLDGRGQMDSLIFLGVKRLLAVWCVLVLAPTLVLAQASFSARLKAEVRYQAGVAHHQAYRYDKAIAAFSQAIALNPSHAKAYQQRGFAHYRQHNVPMACQDWAAACEMDRYCRGWKFGQTNKVC